jgi:hypothetical protein
MNATELAEAMKEYEKPFAADRQARPGRQVEFWARGERKTTHPATFQMIPTCVCDRTARDTGFNRLKTRADRAMLRMSRIERFVYVGTPSAGVKNPCHGMRYRVAICQTPSVPVARQKTSGFA